MTKSVVNKNHDTILQCCLVKNLVRDLFMGENNGTKLLVLPLLFFNPQSLHISLEFKNLFEVLSLLRRRFDLPSSRSVDRVARPVCGMDADGLFIGDATLRKIFCLQETLRGLRGRPPLNESLLQPDRVLFLPSPLLREKTAASVTPDKRVRCQLTQTLFSAHFYKCRHTNISTHTHNGGKIIQALWTDKKIAKMKLQHTAPATNSFPV